MQIVMGGRKCEGRTRVCIKRRVLAWSGNGPVFISTCRLHTGSQPSHRRRLPAVASAAIRLLGIHARTARLPAPTKRQAAAKAARARQGRWRWRLGLAAVLCAVLVDLALAKGIERCVRRQAQPPVGLHDEDCDGQDGCSGGCEGYGDCEGYVLRAAAAAAAAAAGPAETGKAD